MSNNLITFNGGKGQGPKRPRTGKIVITIPDCDDPTQPIHLNTEEGDPMSLAEVVFALVTASNMLTFAVPTPDKE